jgi:pilus assembly protein CpaF
VHANFGASAPKGACVTLRRIAQATTTLADLVNQRESLSAEAAEFLLLAVGSHKNILVSGGTGSGKTTLLRCLCEGIPLHERIVLIEDTAELTFRQPDVVSLLTRPADGYGEGAITIRDLFKSALRLRPDRVIIGEIRGAEAFDLLQALGSGHSGALCTVHADSPFLALSRIHALASMSGLPVPSSVLHRQIQEVLHYVVQVDRAGSGARRVAGIARVEESHEGNWALTQVFDRQVTGGGAATLTWAGNADPWLDRIPVDALRKAAPTLVEVMLRGRASSS